VTDAAPALALARGRRVSLLPRSGGHSWAGTVRAWDAFDGHVVAHIDADADAVNTLDHHQVWLSTVSRNGEELGVTIFAGRAHAVDRESLKLDGVVWLADERRRSAVRATGSMVTVPPSGGPQRRLATLDISRGGVRLPVDADGWNYEDPLDLVVHLGDTVSISVLGRLLRVDVETASVVLGFEGLTDADAETLDRFALAQLPGPDGGAAGG
jgi:hypothetical protein